MPKPEHEEFDGIEKCGIFLCTMLLSFFVQFLAAFPFWLIWNWLAPVYLGMLPTKYTALPFWHTVGIFWIAGYVRYLIGGSAMVYRDKRKNRAAGRGEAYAAVSKLKPPAAGEEPK